MGEKTYSPEARAILNKIKEFGEENQKWGVKATKLRRTPGATYEQWRHAENQKDYYGRKLAYYDKKYRQLRAKELNQELLS